MKRQIRSKISIVLEPIGLKQSPGQPLFAINWFNTRLAWLYTLYNYLAAIPLIRAGASVFVKARLRKTLQGEEADSRNLLLVVNYPSGERFLDLLGNRFFQLISLLRILAVKDFSFVLHKRLDGSELLKPIGQGHDSARAYAVHHFNSSAPLEEELPAIAALIASHNVSLRFGGEKAATVAIENSQGQSQLMPFVTHKMLLYEATSYHELEAFLTGQTYQKFCAGLDSSFIGTLNRIM